MSKTLRMIKDLISRGKISCSTFTQGSLPLVTRQKLPDFQTRNNKKINLEAHLPLVIMKLLNLGIFLNFCLTRSNWMKKCWHQNTSQHSLRGMNQNKIKRKRNRNLVIPKTRNRSWKAVVLSQWEITSLRITCLLTGMNRWGMLRSSGSWPNTQSNLQSSATKTPQLIKEGQSHSVRGWVVRYALQMTIDQNLCCLPARVKDQL